MREASQAWLCLGIGITAYELLCPPGETLSEGVDAALESHKALTALAIGITTLHLINLLPPRLDPFTQALRVIKGDSPGGDLNAAHH